jgi:integrase
VSTPSETAKQLPALPVGLTYVKRPAVPGSGIREIIGIRVRVRRGGFDANHIFDLYGPTATDLDEATRRAKAWWKKTRGEIDAGTWTDPRIAKAAERNAAEHLANDRQARVGKRRASMTLKELIEAKFDVDEFDGYRRAVSMKKKSYESAEKYLLTALIEEFGSRRLADIRKENVLSWKNRLLTEPRSTKAASKPAKKGKGQPVPNTASPKPLSTAAVRHRLALLSHIFSVAIDVWEMEGLTNPTRKLLDAPSKRKRRLVDDEEKLLLAAAEKVGNAMIRQAIVCALEIGARRGEIVALQYRDIDFAAATAVLRDTKNGTDRTVALSGRAVTILKTMPVPVDRGQMFKITGNGLYQAWTRVTKEAGISNLRFHDLRHEAVPRQHL